MAFEVPTDLIRQVQILLRNEAGLASYDPDDPSIPNLPSLDDSIAEFDPSPPYLRCKHCRGRLLRGLQSVICVYCGEEQRKEVAPEPISFKSTVGYRWLLESLDLDGSETVGPSVEANKLNRGQSAPKDESSLSDILDLEVKWPAESEKLGTSVLNKAPGQSKSSLNLAGVDLDNFFSETKRETVLKESEEQLVPNTQIKSAGSDAFQGNENRSLFESVQPSDTPVRSTDDESGAPFSGWEADFQPASSGTLHEDPKSFDLFMGSTVDLSVHMDTVFGPGKDLKDGKPKDDSFPPASMTNDWIQDEPWNNLNSGISDQADQFVATIKVKDGGTVDSSNNPSSTSVDWIQDDQLETSSAKPPDNKMISEDGWIQSDQWKTSSTKPPDNMTINEDDWIQDNQWQTSSTKAPDNKMISEDDDSFDEFRSFTSALDPSKSSLKQSGNDIIHADGQTSEIALFSSTNDLQEMEFDFSQSDLFSGAFSNQNSSIKANNTESEASVPNRIADLNVQAGGNADQAAKGEDIFNATMQSKTEDVDMLMSQMHDLSFMLESSLSIPKT